MLCVRHMRYMGRPLGFHAHRIGDQVMLGAEGKRLVQLLEFRRQSNGLSSRRGLLIDLIEEPLVLGIGTESAVELQRMQMLLVLVPSISSWIYCL